MRHLEAAYQGRKHMDPITAELSLLSLYVVVNRRKCEAFVMDESEAEAYARGCMAYLGNTRRGWYTDFGPIDICLFPDFHGGGFLHVGAYRLSMSQAMLILTQADL